MGARWSTALSIFRRATMKSMLRPLTYGTLIALVLAFLAASAQGPNAAEQNYKRLLAEWDGRLSKLSDSVDKADSKEAKEAANKGLRAERQNYAIALIQFAQNRPNDSLSVDVLLQSVKVDRSVEDRAFAALAKNHAKDPKMAKLGFYLGVTMHSAAAEKLL